MVISRATLDTRPVRKLRKEDARTSPRGSLLLRRFYERFLLFFFFFFLLARFRLSEHLVATISHFCTGNVHVHTHTHIRACMRTHAHSPFTIFVTVFRATFVVRLSSFSYQVERSGEARESKKKKEKKTASSFRELHAHANAGTIFRNARIVDNSRTCHVRRDAQRASRNTLVFHRLRLNAPSAPGI